MGTRFFIIALLVSSFCFSQELVTGFYQVDDENKGVLIKELGGELEIYIIPVPILVLEDVADMNTYLMEYETSHSIAFELNNKGTQKLKNFAPKKYPTKMALVLGNKYVSNASIYNPIPNGMFILNGFNEKKAKAVVNKLKEEQKDSNAYR